MRIIILAALFACALSAEHTPRWVLPRLPLSVLLSGKAVVYDANAPKIVGGVECEPNELPFQLSLQRRGTGGFSQSCGGSILAADVTINAAHCVRGLTDLTILRLVAGEHSFRTVSGKEQNRNVARYIIHENYRPLTSDNDISLIFPDTPFDLSVPEARAITLPPQGSDPEAGTVVTVSGWGLEDANDVLVPDKLRKVDVPIVSRQQCNVDYTGSITENMICAGVRAGGVDSCQGDSGGPLFTGNGQSEPFVQHGIVSWGRGCAEPNYPGVYTRVGNYVDWIARNRG